MKLLSTLATMSIAIMAISCADQEAPVDEIVSENGSETIEASDPVDPTEAAEMTEGFSTPESVLYDPDQGVYFVSNINGAPLDADDNGYVSRIDAENRTMTEKWIDGTADDVELSAPKGMAILGQELWISDIDQVRRFDRQSGSPLGSIAVEGATFLNDVATGNGAIYVSDSGMDKNFEPTGSDQVYRITPEGAIEKLATNPDELNGPNGVAVIDGSIWVVTFSSNEIFRLETGEKTDVVTLPAGSLDGIVVLPDGEILVSSWEGKAVYRGSLSGPFEAIVSDVTSPADLGYDSNRHLLLIPVFQEDRIMIHPIDETGSDAGA